MMDTMRLTRILALTVLLMITASCATTTLTKVWKEESFQGPPLSSVFVIGLIPNASTRKMFEDEFVRQLAARGVSGTASHGTIPFDKVTDKSLVASQIKAADAASLVAARFVKREVVTMYIPGTVYALPYDYYYNWPAYVESSTGLVQGAPEVIKDDISFIETNVYDAGTEKLIWSALSETWMIENLDVTVREFSKAIIGKLASDRIIR